jgi:hypothetical protein
MKHGDWTSVILLFSGFITLVLSGAVILPCLLQRLFAGAKYQIPATYQIEMAVVEPSDDRGGLEMLCGLWAGMFQIRTRPILFISSMMTGMNKREP